MYALRSFSGAAMVMAFTAVLACSGLQPSVQRSTLKIPPGMRAVSVQVNDVSGIVAGEHVDLLVTTPTETAVVLWDVGVAASKQMEPNVGVVTFITSPQDAEKVMLASQKGQFQLIPHNSHASS